MTSSLKKRSLSKPKRDKRIPLYDLVFARSRNKNKIHSWLLDEFQKSEITKAELAKMLGKRPEQITRWLGGPGNLTIDTISDLVFALRGEFLHVQSSDDLSKKKSNFYPHEWLTLPREPVYKTSIDLRETALENIRSNESSRSSYLMKISGSSSAKEVESDRYKTKHAR